MEEGTQLPLRAWESFYVIVGSSGAALTGLQFVVIALIAESRKRATAREISAFGTPTIIHFCAVLLVSAILSAPWHGLTSVSLALGICGVVGVVYGVIVVRRAQVQTAYRPVFEDWLWHAALPLIAYAFLLISAIMITRYPRQVLFAVGATALLLLFIGIHNAWDTVTYITVWMQPPKEREEQEDQVGQEARTLANPTSVANAPSSNAGEPASTGSQQKKNGSS
jgi:hypothetical protein